MNDLEKAMEELRKAQELQETQRAAEIVANRKKYADLCKAVRQKTTAATSPRSAAGHAPNYGRTEVTSVVIDQRGLITSATERVKDRGVDIEV